MEDKIRQIHMKQTLTKLESFKELEENWFDPEMKHGVKFNHGFIDKCKELIQNNFDVPPEVFPLCDGGVQIEWTTEPNVTFEVELWKPAKFNKLFVFIADFREEKQPKFDQKVDTAPVQLNEIINKAIKKKLSLTQVDSYVDGIEEKYK